MAEAAESDAPLLRLDRFSRRPRLPFPDVLGFDGGPNEGGVTTIPLQVWLDSAPDHLKPPASKVACSRPPLVVTPQGQWLSFALQHGFGGLYLWWSKTATATRPKALSANFGERRWPGSPNTAAMGAASS